MILHQDAKLERGRYIIEARAGQGAFAVVYRARDTKLKRTVALKVLDRDAPGVGSTEVSDYRRRFELEAQLGSAPGGAVHLVQVYDWFEEDGHLVLVMTYAPGGSLKDLIETQGAIPWQGALHYIEAAARGLQYLHEALGAVHRDVKPSNILIDADGGARISDLGLAQVQNVDLTKRSELGSLSGFHPGTPGYRSPEHDGWEPLGPTSDVYSLGCVAFELLTGQPWKGVRHKVTRIRDLQLDVPVWLDDVVMRMLSPVPGTYATDAANADKRYVDMATVLAALDEGGQAARRPRWPVMVGVAAFAIVALVFALGVVSLALRGGLRATPPQMSIAVPVATLSPRATPSPVPTATPLPKVADAPISEVDTHVAGREATSTPIPTMTPTPVPTDPPSPTPKPTDTLESLARDMVETFQQARSVAYETYDTDAYADILAGDALGSALGTVGEIERLGCVYRVYDMGMMTYEYTEISSERIVVVAHRHEDQERDCAGAVQWVCYDYDAEYVMEPVDGAWRITRKAVLELTDTKPCPIGAQ